MNDYELYHHGILGMRWGIRRNRSDGVSKSSSSAGKKSLEEQKNNILKTKSAKKLYKNSSKFSDQELLKAYNRLAIERNIKNIADTETSFGKKFIDNSASFLNNSAKVLDSSIKIYKSINELSKTPYGSKISEVLKTYMGKDGD